MTKALLLATFLPVVFSTCIGECEETVAVQVMTKKSSSLKNEADATNIGYWAWQWSAYLYGPENQTFGICFGGYATAQENLNYCADDVDKICSGSTVNCTKWLAVGGGTVSMNQITLTGTVSLAASIFEGGWQGVIFDAENMVQDDSGNDLVTTFEETTASLKKAGLLVGVTTSHSGPLTCSGCIAGDLVLSWVKDPNIDILSPQMYTSGYTLELEPTTACQSDTPACTWDLWQNASAPIVPSIPYASNYDETYDFFLQNYSISLGGYIQWLQSYNGVTTYWCGSNWEDAVDNCYKMRPSGQASDCDEGQACYQPITTCSTSTTNGNNPGPANRGRPRHHRRYPKKYS